MNNRFIKVPLSKEAKEKKAADFLNFAGESDSEGKNQNKIQVIERVLTKETTKRITVRLPVSLADDVTEISALTGLSINSVILELLRSTAKQKLKDLKS